MNIQRVREKDLTPVQAAEILELQHAAFPATKEFETQRWYHTPLADDEMWFFGYKDGRLICSVRVVHRTITVGTANFRVAGIANVGSHPDARGTGAGKACMQAVGQYISQAPDLDFGVLFTGPPTDGFYAKLGWKTITNQYACANEKDQRVTHDPKDGGVRMIYPGRQTLEKWPDGVMDLNGRDW